MSSFACYNLQERLMPYLRAETARRLSDRGLRQGRIAEHLGVSQAMVSKYLRGRSAPGAPIPAPALATLVERSVAMVLEDEDKGRVGRWCPICPQLPGRGSPGDDECLRGDATTSQDEAKQILENLRAAAQRIAELPFSRLAPQVQVNLAMATRDGREARAVAAFPGRLVPVRGTLRPVNEPEFGASHHLSDVLLKVRRSAPAIRAVACVRDGEDIRGALRRAGLRSFAIRRKGDDLVITLPRGPPPDALIDPGAFGIEPITYLLGETAQDAVEKGARLLPHLTSSR